MITPGTVGSKAMEPTLESDLDLNSGIAFHHDGVMFPRVTVEAAIEKVLENIPHTPHEIFFEGPVIPATIDLDMEMDVLAYIKRYVALSAMKLLEDSRHKNQLTRMYENKSAVSVIEKMVVRRLAS